MKWRLGLRSGYNVNTVYEVDDTVESYAEKSIATVYGIPMHCSAREVVNHPKLDADRARTLKRALLIGELIAAAPELLDALRVVYNNQERCNLDIADIARLNTLVEHFEVDGEFQAHRC